MLKILVQKIILSVKWPNSETTQQLVYFFDGFFRLLAEEDIFTDFWFLI